MKKQGFTLIELLAVIVILAIIALIAVPIVIHIINDSKKNSEEESLKLYQDAVQKAIARKQLEDSSFNPSECKINNGNLDCNGVIIEVEMKGKRPEKGTIIIEGNKVSLKNIKYNEKIYYKESFAKLVLDLNNDNKISIGDKYTYKVNDNDTFNFYVLSMNSDNTVNLIMDRNICNDGTANYTSGNSYCRYKWYALENNNTYGPVTAMQELYDGTKEWDNVPTIELNYTDEANKTVEDKGYTSVITANGIATITGKPTTNTTTINTSSSPLKARLPKESEIIEAGCTTNSGSCPIWLMKNLQYSNVANDKYSINNNSEIYQNIIGYWLLSSNSGYFADACNVYSSGRVRGIGTTYVGFGIRPVITVPLSDLK